MNAGAFVASVSPCTSVRPGFSIIPLSRFSLSYHSSFPSLSPFFCFDFLSLSLLSLSTCHDARRPGLLSSAESDLGRESEREWKREHAREREIRASERYALSCERERERERELVLTRERGRKPVREIERARAREREPARACARTGDGAIVVNSFFQN